VHVVISYALLTAQELDGVQARDQFATVGASNLSLRASMFSFDSVTTNIAPKGRLTYNGAFFDKQSKICPKEQFKAK
jgi:hypothetical protein